MKPGARPVRILVVEDEPLIAMVIEDALETLGWDMVGPIARLDEALAAAETEDFDCALLDVNIRGGTSYPVGALLLERGCPVLFATGHRDGGLPGNLTGAACLEKPYMLSQLESELLKLVERAE